MKITRKIRPPEFLEHRLPQARPEICAKTPRIDLSFAAMRWSRPVVPARANQGNAVRLLCEQKAMPRLPPQL
jgi:hypothetical protein